MKSISFLFIPLSIACSCTPKTQLPPPPPPGEYSKEWVAEEERLKTYTKFTIRKRNHFYPFSRAFSVYLAYFDFKDSDGQRTLPFRNGAVDTGKINTLVRLNGPQTDTLTDILYNSGNRQLTSSISRAGCYYPRNAILFSDRENRVFDYIEICFDCHQFKKSRHKVRFDTDDFNNDSLHLLESFFNQHGLLTTGEK